jgi:hypothetical protein
MVPYFICNDKYLLAFVAKTGSNSFAEAILQRHYPKKYNSTNKVRLAADGEFYHNLVPKKWHADRPVVQIFRDPVDRFKSAVAFLHYLKACSVEEIISDLINETNIVSKKAKKFELTQFIAPLYKNVHFQKQHQYVGLVKDIRYFRFNDQILDAAKLLDIQEHLQNNNRSNQAERPTLTKSQIVQIQDFYAMDMEKWESIQD